MPLIERNLGAGRFDLLLTKVMNGRQMIALKRMNGFNVTVNRQTLAPIINAANPTVATPQQQTDEANIYREMTGANSYQADTPIPNVDQTALSDRTFTASVIIPTMNFAYSDSLGVYDLEEHSMYEETGVINVGDKISLTYSAQVYEFEVFSKKSIGVQQIALYKYLMK